MWAELHLWLLLLVLHMAPGASEQLSQSPSALQGQEGQDVELRCDYSTAQDSFTLDWYQQQPGGQPAFLVGRYSFGSRRTVPSTPLRFSTELDAGGRASMLSIAGAQPADSALYLCALRGSTIGGITAPLIFGKGTRLTVEPKSDPKEPSVLLMKSKASSDHRVKAACLAKDFYPKNVTFHFGVSHEVVYEQKDPVLSANGKYSAIKVAEFNENEEVDCSVQHTEKNFTAQSSQPAGSASMPATTTKLCDVSNATAEEENPETVNMLPLTVLGLRFLFAKSIAFNTLMTIKLFVF